MDAPRNYEIDESRRIEAEGKYLSNCKVCGGYSIARFFDRYFCQDCVEGWGSTGWYTIAGDEIDNGVCPHCHC